MVGKVNRPLPPPAGLAVCHPSGAAPPGTPGWGPRSAGGTDKTELLLLDPMSLKSWIKKLGFWGFLFFLAKGLLWLTIPALIAIFAD